MTWVAENARDGSLLVEGSRNYPSHFLNYERFTYVAIAREPAESRERVLRDPERHLARWLDNEAYADTYVIITRSQKVEVDRDGSLPQGSLERIERILRRSDRFRVAYSTRDAVVFELEEGARR